MDEDIKKALKHLGFISTIGVAMALSIVLGFFIGNFIDNRFATTPWFTIIFLIFGIIAAFRNLFILYKKTKER